MFQLYIDLLSFQSNTTLSYFVYIFLFSWVVYFVRLVPGLFWYSSEPLDATYLRTQPMNVIIPVVDEPIEIFEQVLCRINEYRIPQDHIIVVQNGPTKNLRAITQEYNIDYVYSPKPSKRNAIKLGLSRVSHPNTILVDSDSMWDSDCFGYFERELNNPLVGGVTSQQYIAQEGDTIQARLINRYALMLENMRNSISFKSQSVFGQIGCLPGRTIAFRTSILRNHMTEFMNDYVLGYRIEFSDDRFLTNKALLDGYRTVYAEQAIVRTNAPETLPKYIKQQLRWARGSQINNMRMIPEYIKHGHLYIACMFTADTLLPFLWLSYMIGSVYNSLLVPSEQVLILSPLTMLIFAIGSIIGSYLIKYGLFSDTLRGLDRTPLSALASGTLFACATILVMTPLRVYGFVTMLLNLSWGTRNNSYEQNSDNTLSVRAVGYAPSLVGLMFILANLFLVITL